MQLPNISGQGSIFAFSGLDGPTSYEGSLIGALSGDRIGILFHGEVRPELRFFIEHAAELQYEIVTGTW